ncbi:hsp70-Hsp90 organizing protein 3 [Nilaparvata lugens]|uniref:hsp70-Hsp90 organizing protein 3 n=1 Tax=Nilaparvata lugens TaxID=108931 RepID=UPI00193EAF54|nr:hsp70-Hsp90 organizing protein 3 [Nilaparvata lugens]
MSLEDLGQQAYQKANLLNDHKGAVEILNKAIGKYPADRRLYNNRSFCYFKLGKYDKALEDATFMVRRFPDYIKSHFRRGEALFKLKNLLEAEKCFKKAYEMDPQNEEVLSQLMEVQTELLSSGKSYHAWHIYKALKLAEHDTTVAAYLLENGCVYSPNDDEIYVSDEEVLEVKVQPVKKNSKKHKVQDPFTE